MSTKEVAYIQDKKTEENISTTEGAFAQAQTPVKHNLPVSFTLRRQLDIQMSKLGTWKTSVCIKLGNKLVITDFTNIRLVISNLDGADIHHIPLLHFPYYITAVYSNTVAVSCTNNRIILIIDISTCAVTSTIKTSDCCNGLSYKDNQLYVVIGRIKIHVMDLSGDIIRTIYLPSTYTFGVTVDRNRVVCIDHSFIYCCSLDGKLIWKFKNEKYQSLNRVTTDDEGNVYMTDWTTGTVVVVSDDGKTYREILTKSDGLIHPGGIYFDRKEHVLFVCNNNDGRAFIFDVKKKIT
ncbi:AASDH [Mytilus coruscus]|uniref:AASDH n=1 Tax=Mytilus coruscus TaxID=42192 RepID=A0A6J8EKF2_MYTCO|nr:AASDH [Mytilus coruscus]